MKKLIPSFSILAIALAGLAGCSSHEVEVSGTSQSQAPITGTVKVRVYEVDGDQVKLLEAFDAEKDGAWKRTFTTEAQKLRAVAFEDLDAGGACGPGEASGQAEGTVVDDALKVTVMLAAGPCVAMP